MQSLALWLSLALMSANPQLVEQTQQTPVEQSQPANAPGGISEHETRFFIKLTNDDNWFGVNDGAWDSGRTHSFYFEIFKVSPEGQTRLQIDSSLYTDRVYYWRPPGDKLRNGQNFNEVTQVTYRKNDLSPDPRNTEFYTEYSFGGGIENRDSAIFGLAASQQLAFHKAFRISYSFTNIDNGGVFPFVTGGLSRGVLIPIYKGRGLLRFQAQGEAGVNGYTLPRQSNGFVLGGLKLSGQRLKGYFDYRHNFFASGDQGGIGTLGSELSFTRRMALGAEIKLYNGSPEGPFNPYGQSYFTTGKTAGVFLKYTRRPHPSR